MSTFYTSTDADSAFRLSVDDPLNGVAPNPVDQGALWSEVEVLHYINSGLAHWAEAVLPKNQTFNLPIRAVNGGLVYLPKGYTVLDISRAVMQGVPRVLTPANVNDLMTVRNYGYSSMRDMPWELFQGVPLSYVRDYKPGALRLVPAPVYDDTLVITAVVAPAPVLMGDPLVVSEEPDFHLLQTWMKKLAYEKNDADTFDPKRAATYEAEFAVRSIERRYQLQRRHRAVPTTIFQW